MKTLNNPVKGAVLAKFPQGNIYQLYGENVELYLKAIGSKGHNGIDIAMPEGIPILASKGEVVEVKDTPEGYGKHIRILTDPENGVFYELAFGHLRNIIIKIGDKVEDGQQIAEMSNTGFVISGGTAYWNTAPAGKGVHLHFGVRECSIQDTGFITTYSSGKTAYVKNYTNDLFGYLDPQLFLKVSEGLYLKTKLGLLSTILELLKKLLKGR